MRNQIAGLCGLFIAAALPGACKREQKAGHGEPPAGHVVESEKHPSPPEAPALPPPTPVPATPLGLPETPAPADNPITAAKVELGKLLFFDKRLSDGGEFSCETCHLPEKGWGDGLAVSPKHDGSLNTRHSPALWNVAYANAWYWDGRKPTLESQITAAWTGQVGGTPEKVVAKLAAVPSYAKRFERAFGEGPSPATIAKALAAFVSVLRSGNSPWDRHERGDHAAVSDEVRRGWDLFRGKAQCAVCHMPPLYSDYGYHNVGVGYEGTESPDVGRGKVSEKEADIGAFKTPTLRGVVLHPPYFHNGQAKTLEKAIDFMIAGGYRKGNPHIDPALAKVKLSGAERAALLAFVRALTPVEEPFARPVLP